MDPTAKLVACLLMRIVEGAGLTGRKSLCAFEHQRPQRSVQQQAGVHFQTCEGRVLSVADAGRWLTECSRAVCRGQQGTVTAAQPLASSASAQPRAVAVWLEPIGLIDIEAHA